MYLFYVYIWLRYDGTPYYVGKGKGNRAFVSLKRHRPPTDRELIIVQEFESEEDAFFAEKFLIAYWGRKNIGTGILINLYEGGQGMVLPKESIKKRQDARYGPGYVRKWPERKPNREVPLTFAERSEIGRMAGKKAWEVLRSKFTPEQLSEKKSQAMKKAWAKRDRTPPIHCRNGHLLTPENIYFYKGRRYCRTCQLACQARYLAKKPSIVCPT
jgi:hypothetical protein